MQSKYVWIKALDEYNCKAQFRVMTHLNPVSEPVALRIGAFYGEQHIPTRDNASLRHSLDLDGQVTVVFLQWYHIRDVTEHSAQTEKSERRVSPYLQNVIPSLFVEHIILKVFPVDLLCFLNLRWCHNLSCESAKGQLWN